MSDSPHSDLVHRFTEDVWNARRLELLDQLVSDNYQLRNLSDDTIPVGSRAQLRDHIEEWLAAFPDVHMRELDQLAAGPRVVSVARVTGTHTGRPFQGVQAAGASIDVALITSFDSDGERLTGHGTLLDARRLMQQLQPASGG